MILLGIDQPDTFNGLVVVSASAALLACSLWLVAIVLAVFVEAVSDGRLTPAARIGCPPGWRRVLVSLFTAALAGISLAPTAQAAQRPEPTALDGLPLPDRVVDSPPAARSSATNAVVVRPRDTLWRLAARALPGDASTTQIAASVAAWHTRNRSVIGADPDVLHPGQRLVQPASDTPPEGTR